MATARAWVTTNARAVRVCVCVTHQTRLSLLVVFCLALASAFARVLRRPVEASVPRAEGQARPNPTQTGKAAAYDDDQSRQEQLPSLLARS